jgi:hypothetical protein
MRLVTRSPATAPEKVTARIPQAVSAKANVKDSMGRVLGTKIAKASGLLQGLVVSQQLAIAKVAIRKFEVRCGPNLAARASRKAS